MNAAEQLYKDAAELASTLNESVMYSMDLENQLNQTRAELDNVKKAVNSRNNEVVLQKVAFDTTALNKTLDVLEQRDLIGAEDREKFASRLSQDPNTALNVIEQIATIQYNLPVAASGRGISKSAGSTKHSSDGAINLDHFGSVKDWL